MTEVERWSKGASAQIDAQLKERRRNFSKRIEAIERIQSAAGNLDERLIELAAQESNLAELHVQLREFTSLIAQHGKPQVAATVGELRAA
jgi:hypothetical protein